MSTHKNSSDVARLLQQIDKANEAAYQALYGLAAGIARHDIISAKMEYIGRCHEQLADLVGKDEAAALVCQVIEQSGERHGQEKDGQHDENLKGGRALIDPTYTDLFTHFQQRLSSVGGEFHQVASLVEAAVVIAAHPALISGEIVVPPNFGQHQQWGAILPLLSSKGLTIREAGSPASVADAPAGLSGAELAIAETGSVLLAENSLEARVVSMLTLTHFVLVSQDKLVPLLDDAVVILQQLARAGSENQGVAHPHGREGIETRSASSAEGPYYMSFVTGPSRTADIERTLTIGVQGPKTLCVILVANEEGAKP
jgi:L-lactate dehydrogenase complex protein LldG